MFRYYRLNIQENFDCCNKYVSIVSFERAVAVTKEH